MTASDRRIDNLYGGLNARERAVLAIKAWKEGKREDPWLRWSVPPEQENELAELLGYARGLGLALAALAPIWVRALEKHQAHQGWLLSMELTEIYVSSLSRFIVSSTREQITESQYARLVDQERAQLVPLADLAELLVEENGEWREDDLKDGDVTDRAYARVTKEKKALVRRLFEEGTISGRRKGKAVELNQGSFYDWLGEPVPIFPDWGLDYEVVPDDQEEKARRDNDARDYARSMIQRALGDGSARRMGEEPSERDLYAMVEKALVADLISDSREIRASDLLVAEFQQRLGGEDHLDPEVRKMLDFCRAELAKMRDEQGVDADEAIEDCAEDLEMMRGFIKREQ